MTEDKETLMFDTFILLAKIIIVLSTFTISVEIVAKVNGI